MPWKEVNVMDQRIEFVARAIVRQGTFTALCKEYGVSRQTGYRWLNRYKEVGTFTQLQEVPRRPHHSPNRTSVAVEDRIVELRQRYGWGAKKLCVLLEDEGIKLSVRTINRIIGRRGLIDPQDSHPPATKQFERAEPNQLWQMDFKGPFEMRGGKCCPLSIVDDHSRYLVGLYALPNIRADGVHHCLVECFESNGVPEAMLMDHGIPWWSPTNHWGLTWLSVSLIKQGIRLHNGRIRHPQTQGKVERFHRTLKDGLRHHGKPRTLVEATEFFSTFREEYNQIRPHEGIGMATPATRYEPSSKAFNLDPPDWEYPSDWIEVKLNSQGKITWSNARHFVCEALAHEFVAAKQVADTVLVRYRQMYIREIDLKSKRSRPILHVASD